MKGKRMDPVVKDTIAGAIAAFLSIVSVLFYAKTAKPPHPFIAFIILLTVFTATLLICVALMEKSSPAKRLMKVVVFADTDEKWRKLQVIIRREDFPKVKKFLLELTGDADE